MTSIKELIHEIDDGSVPDAQRRKLLLTATSVVGGVGLVAAAYPFVASFEPSELARALGGRQLPTSPPWRRASCASRPGVASRSG